MSATKTELRAAAMSEVGASLEDELEKELGLARATAGAVAAYDRAAADIGKHTVPVIQAMIDRGDIGLEEGKLAIDWLTKAINIVKNLGGEARHNGQKLEGAVNGLRRAVQITATMHAKERAKIRTHGDEVPQASAELPPKRETLKQRRTREEAEKAPAKPTRKRATKKRITKKARA